MAFAALSGFERLLAQREKEAQEQEERAGKTDRTQDCPPLPDDAL